MSDAFICDFARTPIGRYAGALKDVRTDDLAAHPIRVLKERNAGVDWDQLDDCYMGCANQAGEDNRNVARMATLLAGLPTSVPGSTVNRLCGSGLQAIVSAAQSILLGDTEVALGGGAESMSRSPYNLPSNRWGARMGDAKVIDMMVGALRIPQPIPDIQQERLFDDSAVIVARHGHPVLARSGLSAADLVDYPWVMPRRQTPLRATLDAFLAGHRPRNVIETSSVIMMREILRGSDHLGGLSRMQAEAESEAQALAILPVEVPDSLRPIGITVRAGWEPTEAQRAFLDILRALAAGVR